MHGRRLTWWREQYYTQDAGTEESCMVSLFLCLLLGNSFHQRAMYRVNQPPWHQVLSTGISCPDIVFIAQTRPCCGVNQLGSFDIEEKQNMSAVESIEKFAEITRSFPI